MSRLQSKDLTVGKHIYFIDGAKTGKKHFKEGVVKERYKRFAVVEAKSTFMGASKSYNICLNYSDIDSPDGYCIVQDHIEKQECETQADLVAELE